MKSDSPEFVVEHSKPTKKRRVARKKPEIIQLDDVKDEVYAVKSGGHWKDHWVIQLITIRGERHTIFSQPPKQGNIGITIFNFFFSIFFSTATMKCAALPISMSHSLAVLLSAKLMQNFMYKLILKYNLSL